MVPILELIVGKGWHGFFFLKKYYCSRLLSNETNAFKLSLSTQDCGINIFMGILIQDRNSNKVTRVSRTKRSSV